MTYEEKLEKILSKFNEEKELTRVVFVTKVSFNDRSFTKITISDVCKILLKLQDDEKIIKIVEALQPDDLLDPYDKVHDDNYEKVETITIELLESYEKWYEEYLLKTKTNLGNLDFINLLRIYDVVLDINEQIQLTNKTNVYIHLIPSLIRFQALFPADSIGLRDQYCENRLGSLKYLVNKGAIFDYSYGSSGWTWDTLVEITLKISEFDNFYQDIQAEYIKRHKSDKETEKQKDAISEIDKKEVPAKVTYDPKKGELNIEGKIVKLNKDSFRAKLLELLLKDNKSQKKEWSWDEVIEKIEGTLDLEATKENKKKFYPACDGLSKFIAQKIGVNDLLVFNKSTVQINSKYL